jgi:hypothetical protein
MDFLCSLGLHDLLEGGVGIQYYDMTGCRLAVKKRTALKATEGSYWPKGKPLAAYGQERLGAAAKAGFLILVEGESDCWVLWHHGLPALGIPGASATKTLEREHIEHVVYVEQVQAIESIYVHREPDKGGQTFLIGVCDRLAGFGFRGEVFELRMPDRIKDPADLHVANPDQFKARLAEAIRSSLRLELPRRPSRNGRDAGIASQPKSAVHTVEPYRPFPVEDLPASVAEYVRQAAAALGCDPAYVALPVLAAAASAIGNTRTIRLKRGWTEPSVVWSVIVGESGTLKSPAYHAAVGHLFRVQIAHRTAHNAELAEYREKKRKARQDGTDPGDPPTMTRIICSDVTIERLAEMLEDAPRGLLAGRDELSAWLGSFARYKGKQGGSDLPNWLEIFRAGTIVYDRKTGERRTIIVPNAAVSVTGGIQPGVLTRALTTEFFEAGLAARLLLAMPVAPPKHWSEVEVMPEVEKSYHDVLDKLLGLDFKRDNKDNPGPHVLILSPDAKAAWVRFYDHWAHEQAAVEGELAAAFSKLEAYAARFALLHHVVSKVAQGEDDRAPVGVESVEAGVVLCRWFGAEARRIYASLSESEAQRATRKLVEHIRTRGGRITARELQRSNSRKYPTAEAAEASLETLVADALGVWDEPVTGPLGGQPARQFRLHPTHDTTDTTDDADAGTEDGPADNTPDTGPQTPGISGENPGSVGSVGRRTEYRGADSEGMETDGLRQAPEVVSNATVLPDGMTEGEI